VGNLRGSEKSKSLSGAHGPTQHPGRLHYTVGWMRSSARPHGTRQGITGPNSADEASGPFRLMTRKARRSGV